MMNSGTNLLSQQLENQTGRYLSFSEIIQKRDRSVGGKAYNLALLESDGFQVPEAVVLKNLPENEADWHALMVWWDSIGRPALAARSSALGEDAKNASFAGQLTSVLDIRTEDDLRSALATCFLSKERVASRAYQEHFQQALAGMNVLVQRMIDPKFSGVFFSRDPRTGAGGWLVEVVEGFGEKLVSGQETPRRFAAQEAFDGSSASSLPGWTEDDLQRVIQMGIEMVDKLGFEVDSEWAIDKTGKLWALQARPITTEKPALEAQDILKEELKRLKSTHSENTAWDAQTFVEWTGLPSHLSFSVWQRAFASKGAFEKALQEIGYLGDQGQQSESMPLLEQVFGRACLNLNRLQPLFFGKIPYEMTTKPHPHLVFSWKKIDAPTILHAPSAISRMIAVAWNLQHQDQLLQKCREELVRHKENYQKANLSDSLSKKNLSELVELMRERSTVFSTETLKWPFVLAIVAEATIETLELVLAKDLGKEAGPARLRKWMSSGIKSVTREMEAEFRRASANLENQKAFLEKFGHRGPGELDLANSRWEEIGEKAFAAIRKNSLPVDDTKNFSGDVTDPVIGEIAKDIHPIRRPLAEREWKTLKALLELREEWKMAIMRPYRDLRRIALAIGKVSGMEQKVFSLSIDEMSRLVLGPVQVMAPLIQSRESNAEVFRKISLPTSFALSQLESLTSFSGSAQDSHEFSGDPISPGLASGIVRVVRDPLEADTADWPPNTVIVAEATDPGWTPLFNRAVGVIVARGGVLSHCAIVAREMGLPAISGVQNCTEIFKDGENVWIDGTHGRVTRAPSH